MKIRELIEILQSVDNPDLEVCIPVSRGVPAIGPKHKVTINGHTFGFDWDNGTLFLNTSESLAINDNFTIEAKKYLQRSYESYHINSKENPNFDIAETLKKYFLKSLQNIERKSNEG